MKVLELCLSHGVGGLELYALRTAKQLTRFGCDCVAVVKEGTMLAERMHAEGVRTITLRRLNPLLPWLAARRLAKIIDQEALDVLHMHWGKDINLAVLAKCFARRKVKLVYTRQMMITRSKKDVYHRILYGHIDIYLTITRQLRDKARAFLPMPVHKVQLLYYGVEQPQSLSADQRQSVLHELGVRDGSNLAIGLVGRIEANKGQHLLIEALQMLREQDLAVHATIIGPVMDNAYFSRIQAQVARLGLQGHVTFYGRHTNPIDIMPAFDIVVLATEMETFGLVLIEAMRGGVAVVGSNAGGVPEIIEDGVSGLLFESGNAADLAAKLKHYCKDRDMRSRVAAAGKARADNLFALEQHYQSLKQIFLGLRNDSAG
ncbi:MAG: glycosyltransferase family 4 protein [Deltaproteobacteria bacterium]|nr:glycosyltransferase family 4 protein [Deltaproteobacteria bacterium]